MNSNKSILIYKFSILIILTALLSSFSCSSIVESETEKKEGFLTVPEDFPPVPQPEYNPITKEKAELGRRLFYEKLLSRDMNLPSCSHCMKPEYSFSDCTPVSRANELEPEPRNAMCLINAAYRDKLFWDGRGRRIEGPAYRSLWLNQILGADTNEIEKRLSEHPLYPSMFEKAFGKGAKPTATNVSLAISTFVRTLISGNSDYDKYRRGDLAALNESEIRGMKLYFDTTKTNCSQCHSGIFFTDMKFHNTGVTTHYFDKGRYYKTMNFKDWGVFITPTLRNIEMTAPYYHNGDLETLEDVINHYNRGGKPFFNRDPLMRPLNLTEQEKADLVAFLKSLTDHEFLANKKFKKPTDNF